MPTDPAAESAKPYRLRLPGPTAVPRRVLEAIARPVVNHRGPEFRAVMDETLTRLKSVFATRSDVLLFAGSGTAVMEAALANVVVPGEPVLIVIHGQFGERFKAIAEGMGAAVDTLDFEWGVPPDPAAVAARLSERPYRAVMVTHNESSTGAVADLRAIGRAVAASDAVLVVDAVSSLGGIELRADEWQLDIVVSAGQKALMCPPGFGLAAVSEKAWRAIERIEGHGVPRFFFDFTRARAAAAKSETPFTAPVSLVAGLREALRMIDEEGLPDVYARHRRLAAALRAGCEAIGLPVFTQGDALSDTVSVLRPPDGIEGGAIVRHLYENYGTVIAGARNRLSGRVIRIGTMGHVGEADILTDLLHLEATLRDLGVHVAPGAGLAAAAASLAG
jgi:aspartate aminotransferase-like enzyme